MKIAIVGSGVSGLVAAHYLHKEHDIAIFEADSRVGGHTHTVEVEDESGRVGVDTGFIVFNEKTYPHFTKLLAELDVESQPTDMSFSVTCRKTGLEYNGSGLAKLFVQKRNFFRPSFYKMISEILRFNRLTSKVVDTPEDMRTIREFVRDHGAGDHALVAPPLSSWICNRRHCRTSMLLRRCQVRRPVDCPGGDSLFIDHRA